MVPVVAALLLLVVRHDMARTVLVAAAALLVAALALVLAAQYLFAPTSFVVHDAELINYLALAISLMCCLYILWRGIKARNYLAILLAAVQATLVFAYEIFFAHDAVITTDLYIDKLSVIMALIIGVIGGGICIYALGYMRDYQEHREQEGAAITASGEPSRIAEALELVCDRRHIFFAVIFVFLGAMFALIFSNRLSWLLTAWEVTTVCSFALIGYSRTEEATKNSFKAVIINLAGGLAFVLALILLAGEGSRIYELDMLIIAGAEGAVTLPIVLIAFAGLTKAAQMPFQGWLLGAMVAPTPVSALLHSSTMVKAGVFLLIKLSPAFGWNIPGLFVLTVGGLTYLLCSALAISQSNSKRVLAYSTVATLGLIACCAGVGTPEAAWAAIFLLVFHALAKALLFCCMGTAEHHLGSRSIEAMDNIFVRMPFLATAMAVGMMAMFIAPMGMLVSKWAALVSIAQTGHFEVLFILAFGSALIFTFWAKWLGKVLAIGDATGKIATKISRPERTTLIAFVVLLLCVTLATPVISELVVLPYLRETGLEFGLVSWIMASDALGYDNLVIMSIILVVLMALLAVQLIRRRHTPNDTVFLSGVGAAKLDETKNGSGESANGSGESARGFYDSFGEVRVSTQRNWYLEQVFGEKAFGRAATILLAVVVGLYLVLGVVAELIIL